MFIEKKVISEQKIDEDIDRDSLGTNQVLKRL
jgi:hypothetical protein